VFTTQHTYLEGFESLPQHFSRSIPERRGSLEAAVESSVMDSLFASIA